MFSSGLRACVAFAAVVTVSCFSLTASATIWDLTTVQTGSQGGFGFSLLHEASPSSPMSGPTIANIVDTGSFGQYDDTTGELTATLTLSGTGIGAGSTISLVTQIGDPLNFNGANQTLGATALVDVFFNVNFTGPVIPDLVTDTTFEFAAGYVCCGNNGFDPNSFRSNGSGGMVMSLWGANDLNLAHPLGIDLRITMNEAIPEPMTAILYGVGLVGLGYARRRRII